MHYVSDSMKPEKFSQKFTKEANLSTLSVHCHPTNLNIQNQYLTSFFFLMLSLAIVSAQNILKHFPVSCHACLDLF